MLEHAEVAMPGEADSNVVRLYLAPDCADCDADTTHVGTLWTTVGSRDLWAFSGRHFVPAGSRLCAKLVLDRTSTSGATVGWSGYGL